MKKETIAGDRGSHHMNFWIGDDIYRPKKPPSNHVSYTGPAMQSVFEPKQIGIKDS